MKTDFSKIEIVDAISFYREKIKYTTEKRGFHVLSMRINGRAVFESNGKTYMIDENDILFIPAGINYCQQTEGEMVVAIHFTADTKLSEIKVYKGEKINVYDDFMEIIRKLDFDNPAKVYKAHQYFYEILYKLSLRNTDIMEKNADKIKIGVEYINENYFNPELSIEKAAEMSFMSSVYFRKLFKALYGKTPKDKLLELRLNHACRLLKNGYCNVNEAAVQSGFYDANYFSTAFKKRLGISPSEYMRLNRE